MFGIDVFRTGRRHGCAAWSRGPHVTQMLASDVRIVTDGGGKVRPTLEVIEGADRAARFMIEVTRKRLGAWRATTLPCALP
jgi:hypothetical protein